LSPTRLSLDRLTLSDPADQDDRSVGSALAMFRNILSRPESLRSYELVSTDDGEVKYPERLVDSQAGRLSDSGVLVGWDTAASADRAESFSGMGIHSIQLDGSADQNRERVSPSPLADAQRRPGSNELAAIPQQRPQLHLLTTNAGSPEHIHPALRHVDSAAEYERHLDPQRAYSAAGDFFKDFDGVHYSPDDAAPLPLPRLELAQPPGLGLDYDHPPSPRRISQHLHEEYPQPEPSNLIYYPAPVPAVLNLPPLMSKEKKSRNRLSRVKKQASHQILRDTQTGNNQHPATPNADAAPPAEVPESPQRRSVANIDEKRLSNLPPALRASTFFESIQPAPVMPDLKDSSAVATLDSILDASASLPAAAFTDHPMTGLRSNTHVRQDSSGHPLNDYRNSVAMTVTLHPGESPRSSVEFPETQQLNPDSTPNIRQSRSFESPQPDDGALPTTLLAELESRKAQQKSRTRTAASAFPSGIRSTLLELDAVAQVQAESRRHRRTHLAWEDPEQAGDGDRDEDVPLGVLYHVNPQRKGGKDNDDVPLGLLMQKQMEDAEPLAKRRERLRQQQGIQQPRMLLDLPDVDETPKEAEEEETLAQRMQRLKAAGSSSPSHKRVSTFGDGSLDLSFRNDPPPLNPPQPVEETLAQRRKRLQDESRRQQLSEEAKLVQAEVRKRASMQMSMQMAGRNTPTLGVRAGTPGGGGLIGQVGGGGMLRPQMSMMGVNMAGGMMGYPRYPAGPPGMMGPMGRGMGAQEAAMNAKQREMVERWRASVM
jgi:hypothetical protein